MASYVLVALRASANCVPLVAPRVGKRKVTSAYVLQYTKQYEGPENIEVTHDVADNKAVQPRTARILRKPILLKLIWLAIRLVEKGKLQGELNLQAAPTMLLKTKIERI